MVRRVYEAQKADPSQGDFTELVANDCEAIELGMSDDEIRRMSKFKFKKVVKSKVLKAAFKYLKDLQQTHSKMDNLQYDKFEASIYLTSPQFTFDNASLLLALRTRTVRGIRNDFGGLYPDKTCPLGCGEMDTLQNILTCAVLKQKHVSKDMSTSEMQYEDIFSSNIVKQQQVTELYRQLLDVRNNILNSLPVDAAGPVHGD